MSCAVKRRLKLKSRYKQRVKAAIEYTKTIDDFNNLVNPRTLTLYCLGLELAAYVPRTIETEEKKSKYLLWLSLSLPFLLSFPFFFFFYKCFPFAGMTTKFNQGMYTNMRAKKNEPFSSLEKRKMRVVEKGVSITPPALVTEPSRIVSLTTSMEEITPLRKKQRVDNKGKDKVDSRSSSVFYDAGLAVARAQDAFTTGELRVFSGMPSNEVVGHHIHKLVQVVYLCNFTLFFSSFASS